MKNKRWVRKTGYYWVQNNSGKIEIAFFWSVNKYWTMNETKEHFKDSDFRRINEKMIEYNITILNQPTLKQIEKQNI